MKKRRGIIYVLKNKINNKCYVGQTSVSFKSRWKSHCGRNIYLINKAINKYNKNNFLKFVFYDIPIELLDYFEIKMIKDLNTISPFGYNLESGGNKNKKINESTRKKLRDSHTGLNCGENHPMYGKTHTKETKLIMSRSHKGKILSDNTKRKIGLWNKGKIMSRESKNKISKANSGIRNGMYGRTGTLNPNYNKKVSDKIKDKIRKKLTGREINLTEEKLNKLKKRMKDNNPMYKEENRQKVSNKLFGRKLTKEHKYKLRIAKLGKKRKPHTKETKNKISIALKGKNNFMHGRKHTKESKANLRKKLKGRISIIKNGQQKFIIKEYLNKYLLDGWIKKGRVAWNKGYRNE